MHFVSYGAFENAFNVSVELQPPCLDQERAVCVGQLASRQARATSSSQSA